jgi:multiple sugar transport system permease protein
MTEARWHGWLMGLPGLAGLTLFVAFPFLLSVVLALTDLRLGSPLPVDFVGLEQFRRLLHDPGFGHALLNNTLFALVVVPVQTVLALAVALALNQALPGRVLLRSLFFLPVVFPLSLVAVVWILIFGPGPQGTLNALLDLLSLGHWEPRDFLHDPRLALPAIMLTSIWQGLGFQMVILLAGLQGIPAHLYEAAAIDGAGPWRRFWHVTLPQLRPTLIFVALVTTILAFRLFDQVRIMTFGGPEDATTTVMFEAVRAGFDRQQVAAASAMSVILFLIVLMLTLAQRRLTGGGTR